MSTNLILFLLTSSLTTNSVTNLFVSVPVVEKTISQSVPGTFLPILPLYSVKTEVWSNVLARVVYKNKTNDLVLESFKVSESIRY
jgi:hypothetical protein